MPDNGIYTDLDGTRRCEACGIPLDEYPYHDAARCYAPWEHGEAGV